MTSHILIIDAGSSSVRAALYTDSDDLQPVSVTSEPHEFQTDSEGASTADPLALRTLIERCIDQILLDLRASGGQIVAVGATSFVGNFLGVSARGKPLTPVSTYADTRAADSLKALLPHIGTAATTKRTGCPMHTAYHPARLRWYMDQGINAPRWIDMLTFCYQTWFGRRVPCSFSVASWSGLLDRSHLTWDAHWLRLLNLTPNHFPALAEFSAYQKGLNPAYATRWPELTTVPFFLAVGDGAAANIGVGASHGEIALTVGTTAALRYVSDDSLPAVPPGLWSYRVTQDLHLIGGALTEGGNIFAWARRTLRLPPIDDLDSALLNHEGADWQQLTFLPLLAGERSPGYQSDAVGTLDGLRLSTAPLDILHAALQGVAFRLALITERLDPEGKRPIYASGGALAASSAWRQIITDALNRPIHYAQQPESTARGAALMVRAARTGRPITELSQPDTTAETIQPRPYHAELIRLARDRQIRLYNLLYKP